MEKQKVFSSIPIRREKSKNIKDIKAEEWFVSIFKGPTGKEWIPTQRLDIHPISKVKR